MSTNFTITDFSYKPLDLNEFPWNSFTLVDSSDDGLRKYYRIEDCKLSLLERISKLTLTIFETLFDPSDGLSLARESIYGKKELILTTQLKFSFSRVVEFCSDLNKQEFINLVKHGDECSTLDLSYSQLTALPESLCNMAKLQTLNLYRNPLCFLPESFGNLAQLRKLQLDRNKLSELPESFGKLAQLQELNLQNNNLNALPESFGNLSRLQRLLLKNNNLKALPASFGKLAQLRELQLDNIRCEIWPVGSKFNHLSSLPESFGHLSQLQHLDLIDIGMRSLPESIGNLVQLRKLLLNVNQFTSVPACLYQLSPACEVILCGNPLIDEAIDNMLDITQQPDYNGPQISFSRSGNRSDVPIRPLAAYLAEWYGPDYPQELLALSHSQKNSLAQWLARLNETQDYQDRPVQTKEKVKVLLGWLAIESNPTNRAQAFTLLADATSTCDDRVALCLNDLTVLMKMSCSSSLTLAELKDLIIGMKRYEMVTEIAKEKCKQLRAVDPVEVYLCYEKSLKDSLQLPLEVNAMIFQRHSQVSDKDIETAKNKILKATDSSKHLEILLQNQLWKRALEKQKAYDSLKQDCDQKKQAALSQIDSTDEKVYNAYSQEFQKNDSTIWNPYYLMTEEILNNF